SSVSHTERHRIAEIINGTIIRTTNPLSYTHHVIRHSFANGSSAYVAAAVGLLTRNIRVLSSNSQSSLAGVKISITNTTSIYRPDILHVSLSNVQFIGFGQFSDALKNDENSGIFINSINASKSRWRTYIRDCSFDGGFNVAISLKSTHSVSISNNVIYNTYRSALVITGRNNLIDRNLITTIYWSGTAQARSVAEKNANYDAAITSHKSTSVTMTNNLVAGVERLAFRINGDVCPGVVIPRQFTNVHSNNEVHSAMAGVSIWPDDRGSVFDRQCILIKEFKVYKAWYYGFYLNTNRNITIDSCASIDNYVGIFAFVIGPPAERHQILPSRVRIRNSVVIGSITPNDCNDKINFNSANVRYSTIAMPTVSQDPLVTGNGSRAGIVFPLFARDNGMPEQSWTGTVSNPSLDGSTSITNTILGFFNDICGRHDTAIQVPQSNTDAKFPIETSSIFRYNLSDFNVIFNGKPDVSEHNPLVCNAMYCDGRKKTLLKDLDGTLFGTSTSAISQAEIVWNVLEDRTTDTEIPVAARTDISGQMINISATYPYRGIAR
ncbi:unnamed protein product, partial [Adineta ricciae]